MLVQNKDKEKALPLFPYLPIAVAAQAIAQ